MDENIISFELKKKGYEKNECKHYSLVIDESKWLIECGDCGAQIDPIWHFMRMANKQNTLTYKIDILRRKWIDIIAKLKTRTRTKCEHCGKMTNIKGL